VATVRGGVRARPRLKHPGAYAARHATRGVLEGDVLIELRIAKDGRLDRVWLLRSSGVPAFDEAALTAVQGAQPFPPVPDEVAKQTLAINAAFRYRIEKK
jgi:TonB family protein